MDASEFLRKKEWSMGNGQCPECCGVPASWHGHPCHLKAESVGHSKRCSLASALVSLGETPLMKGEFQGPDFEMYWAKTGLLCTREKVSDDEI